MRVSSFRRECIRGIGFLSLALHGFVWQLNAQVVSLTDLNSEVHIDLTNPNAGLVGMNYWSLQNGPSQLQQQWFWYRIGSSPEAPINNLGLLSYSPQFGSRGLTATYGNASLTIEVDYLLTGAAPVGLGGMASSHVQETVRIQNISGSALDFHLFQYSDFDLGAPGGDTNYFTTDGTLYNSAHQSDGMDSLTEAVSISAPSADHGETAYFNSTWLKLNDGNTDVLNDNASTGPGNVTWAFEWDRTLAAGDTLIISKDKTLTVLVPEPSSALLLPAALGGLAFIRRRRKSGRL